MKKILSVFLCVLIMTSLLSLAGCGKSEPLKFGIGVCINNEAPIDAEGGNNGKRSAEHTVAGVLLDKDGKIVDCVIDTMSVTMEFTSEGKYLEIGDLKTKYELKDEYGMKKYGENVTKEWYEQVDAFISVIKGKTYDEVNDYLADDGKGTDEVINAGCTIAIKDFMIAVGKAVSAAKESDATADDTLRIGAVTTQTGDTKNATEELEGANVVATTFVVSAIDKDSKVVAMLTDVAESKVTFNNKGNKTTDVTAEGASTQSTKLEAGDKYGMSAYGDDLNGDGVIKEWHEQAAAFNDACKGKTADEIAALAAENGYGVESLQSAGCTINISDMVKAAVKAVK